MPFSVDVVIPTRNTLGITLRCVSAVEGERERVALRCIVIDNASTDGTAEALAERFPNVVIISSEENLGYGQACNLGAARGSGDAILILNSDVFARRGAIARLAHELEVRPELVALGSRIVDAGTERPQRGFAMRGFPTLANQAALMLGLERYWPANPVSRRQLLRDFDYDKTQDVEAQPAGACLLVRRTDFDAIGGFDDGFYYWFEDVDLVRRLQRRGRIGYVHDAVFEHVGGASFALWDRPEIVVTRFRGLLRYSTKHLGELETLVLRMLVAVVAGVRVPFLLVTDRPRARAYLDVIRLCLR